MLARLQYCPKNISATLKLMIEYLFLKDDALLVKPSFICKL